MQVLLIVVLRQAVDHLACQCASHAYTPLDCILLLEQRHVKEIDPLKLTILV